MKRSFEDFRCGMLRPQGGADLVHEGAGRTVRLDHAPHALTQDRGLSRTYQVIDGLGGYWLIEAPDLDTASELLGILPAYDMQITAVPIPWKTVLTSRTRRQPAE